MDPLFLRGHELGGGGNSVTIQSQYSTYVLLNFSILFKTFPNQLTISWNILILTFIDYVDLLWAMVKVTY